MMEQIPHYLFIGIIAGITTGTLGIGSGIIIVPALAYIFTLQQFDQAIVMHLAAGTSLACIAVNTLRALRGYKKRNIDIWPIFKNILPGVLAGTLSGALLANTLHSRTLTIIFAFITLLLGIKMIFMFSFENDRRLPGFLGISLTGFLIGGKSGLLGMGGGAIATPFFTHFGVPIRQAFALATAISITVSLIGSISFAVLGWHSPLLPPWSSGYIYWPAFLSVILGSALTVPMGIRLSHHISIPLLHRLFASMLMLMGLKMLFSVF